MRIGALARRTGTSERALRYYEEQGLLRPARLSSGYRAYADADVRTVRNIRALLAAGLNTATIAETLACIVPDGEALAPACPELVTILLRERARATATIDQLSAARDMLDAVVAAAARVGPEQRNAACPDSAAPELGQDGT